MSVVDVAGTVVYSSPASHTLTGEQILFEVGVGCCVPYSVKTLHSVTFEHTLFEVGVGCTTSYSAGKLHSRNAVHTRSAPLGSHPTFQLGSQQVVVWSIAAADSY